MRIHDFGESDLLVSFLTPDRGRLKGIAKGGRKSRRRFSNCLDMFCLASLEYELKAKGDLHFLHSCRLTNAFSEVRSDFSSLALASHMVELTEILFPPGVVDREMFELLENSFHVLNRGARKDLIGSFFDAKAMSLGGYRIDLNKCRVCGRIYKGEGRALFSPADGGLSCLKCGEETATTPGLSPEAVRTLGFMQSSGWETVEGLSLNDDILREIRKVLKLHIEYRIGRRLKTSEYLE